MYAVVSLGPHYRDTEFLERTNLPTGGLSNFCCNFNFCCSRNDLLLGLTDLPARSFEAKERLNMLDEVEDGASRKIDDAAQ